jgi:2-amino-4-hydroxy-6-hydroxymethyldihydropteridine diphosphokinase/dihydropteroate synthase
MSNLEHFSTNKFYKVAIALGTSIAPREENMNAAVRLLHEHVFKNEINLKPQMSRWYYSRGLVPWGSKDIRSIEYINSVIVGQTVLSPLNLLTELKDIESRLGRDFSALPWSPRPIDLDIIVYNDTNFEDAELIIPHPRAIERHWVLEPLIELWPHAIVCRLEIKNNGEENIVNVKATTLLEFHTRHVELIKVTNG